VVYVPDADSEGAFIVTAYDIEGECPQGPSPPPEKTPMKKKATKNGAVRKPNPSPKVRQEFPKGWDQERVQALIDHYDHLTDAEWAALIEGAPSAAPPPKRKRTSRK
jgi:hypothetical protein